jgi:hypothetical protein
MSSGGEGRLSRVARCKSATIHPVTVAQLRRTLFSGAPGAAHRVGTAAGTNHVGTCETAEWEDS